MGYIIRDNKIQQARRVVGLTSDQKKEIFKQTDKQKEIMERILKRRVSAQVATVRY